MSHILHGNIFGPAKPLSERNQWKDPDIRGPFPTSQVDSKTRIPLTRPSSLRATSMDNSSALGSFEALPIEIRQKIWEEVVGNSRTFHLVTVKEKLVAPECRSLHPDTCDGNCRRINRGPSIVVGSRPKSILPLLMTSRQIYTETIGLTYSSNTFETHDERVLEYLPLLLLPQRISTIRSLRFTWRFQRYPPLEDHLDPEVTSRSDQELRRLSWVTIWSHIAAMPHLQTLQVKLDVYDVWWGSFNEESARILLNPIRAVTTPETFILSLPFPPDTTDQFRVHSWSAARGWKGVDPWDELPCTIRRTEYGGEDYC
ncbi:hypothetical protein B0O99DRAFT_696262 [Bisporella sp. PMI_857]|nr:hypothetical protein B0O99DRAFT_696262 [Bisporella sp. PMI_857]